MKELISSSPDQNQNDESVEKISNKSTNAETAKSPERLFLGKTQDGAEVYDRLDSHLHNEGGLTSELLAKAISIIDTKDRNFIKEKVEFGQPIGLQTCVEVGPDDDISMVYRKGRNGQTPMVKNRAAEPCSSIIAIFRKDFSVRDKNVYELLTGYIGEGSPREPWDPGISSEEERQQSEDFWRSHALIYDDSLIDWEKTKAYEFMSEADQETELIRQRTLFAGIFLDSESLYRKCPATLDKRIAFPHVTTAFKPKAEQLFLERIGKSAKIFAIGYGNNGENEGLLVRVEADNSDIQEVCDALDTPHITLSTSKSGQAKNTAFLEFVPLKSPIELTGDYGIFCQGGLITTQEGLNQLKSEI